MTTLSLIGGFISLIMLCWWLWPRKQAPVDPMVQVTDATFAVIEVSLEVQPERWSLVPTKPNQEAFWSLTNHEASIVINEAAVGYWLNIQVWRDGERVPLPCRWKERIGKAAAVIIRAEREERELLRLDKVVAAFERRQA